MVTQNVAEISIVSTFFSPGVFTAMLDLEGTL